MCIKENNNLTKLWHHAPAELPAIEEHPDYEDSIPCLIKVRGRYEVAFYNCYYKCWDDAEGDDCEYDGDTELDFIQLEN